MRRIEQLKEVVGLITLQEAGTPYHDAVGEFSPAIDMKAGKGSKSVKTSSKTADNNEQTAIGGKGFNAKTGKVSTKFTKVPCGGEARMRGGNVVCKSGKVIQKTTRKRPNKKSWYFLRKKFGGGEKGAIKASQEIHKMKKKELSKEDYDAWKAGIKKRALAIKGQKKKPVN